MRLSRRNRHIVVAADFFDQDHAVVWFVRRGQSGEPVDEFWNLGRDSDGWIVLGGGGGSPGADLETRPDLGAVTERNKSLGFDAACPFGFVGGGGSGFQGQPPYIHMQLAQEVVELRFSDREPQRVAEHGYTVLMYPARDRPTISAFDSDGQCLGTFIPERWDRPWWDTLRGWLTIRRGRSSWTNQS